MPDEQIALEAEPLRLFQRLQNELSRLIAGTPSGERLPSEPELARHLGVSRATLREAMRSFEGQGLIRRRQQPGQEGAAFPEQLAGVDFAGFQLFRQLGQQLAGPVALIRIQGGCLGRRRAALFRQGGGDGPGDGRQLFRQALPQGLQFLPLAVVAAQGLVRNRSWLGLTGLDGPF